MRQIVALHSDKQSVVKLQAQAALSTHEEDRMNRLDWRVVIGLVVGAAVLAHWSTVGAGVLLGGAAFLVLQVGLRAWRGGSPLRRPVKETYWRGRRIDLEPRATRTRSVPLRPPLQSILCLGLGSGLAAIAVSMLLGVASRS